MSQYESTPFLVMDAKNLTLIDATRENSPWCLQPHHQATMSRIKNSNPYNSLKVLSGLCKSNFCEIV